MVVRDADPETIARVTQPPRASKTTAPVVDALDQHMRSSKGMVMGQSFGASGPIAMGAAAPGGSRPGSAKPAIFAGGSGGHSRPVSKQQQRHKIACDAVWPDGPPAEPAAPQPGAASLGMSGGLGQGRAAAAAGRRGAPAEIPDEFAALGLGSGPSGNGARAVAGGLGGPAGGIGLGGGNALASGGGVPGRRIQGMPFPDATAPRGWRQASFHGCGIPLRHRSWLRPRPSRSSPAPFLRSILALEHRRPVAAIRASIPSPTCARQGRAGSSVDEDLDQKSLGRALRAQA